MFRVLQLCDEFRNKADYFPTYPKSILRLKLEIGVALKGEFPNDVVIEIANSKTQSDLYELGGVFYCSGNLKTAIEKVDDTCQFFPVKSKFADGLYPTDDWQTDFYVLNITNRIAAIDPKGGKYKRHSGEIVEIISLKLDEEKLADVHICRLDEDFSIVVVSDHLVSSLQESGINGAEIIDPVDFSNEIS